MAAPMKRTILLALLLTCGAAQASDWVSVYKADDGQREMLVDVSSISDSGSIRRVWAKMTYARRTENDPSDPIKRTSYNLARLAFNCTEDLSRTEAVTVYYEDGSVEALPPAMYPKPWEPVPPDTVLSNVMEFVCAWKPK